MRKGLIIFLAGAVVGSGITWFFLQPPETREHLIESAKERVHRLTNRGSDVPAATTYNSSLTNRFTYGGFPLDVSYPGELTILKNVGYAAGYDEERNDPAWVCYRLFKVADLVSGDRPSRFAEDTRTLSRIDHGDYTNSGFDRGHLAPNYAISTRYGVAAQRETFLMSNIVPQKPDMNQGPWRILEETISDYAQRFDEVWVITGPLYDDRPTFIGPQVEVPDSFFKIVVDQTGRGLRVLAFIMPQDVRRSDDPVRFLRSVDEIEAYSGLDFLSALPDEVETALEASCPTKLW